MTTAIHHVDHLSGVLCADPLGAPGNVPGHEACTPQPRGERRVRRSPG
jgi:hypothetical protein